MKPQNGHEGESSRVRKADWVVVIGLLAFIGGGLTMVTGYVIDSPELAKYGGEVAVAGAVAAGVAAPFSNLRQP